MSVDCRIDFAVVCRVVFKAFPCRLWVEGRAVERRALPLAAALASRRRWPVVTLLSSANTSRQRYLQVPSRHHGEVRVVAGLGKGGSTRQQPVNKRGHVRDHVVTSTLPLRLLLLLYTRMNALLLGSESKNKIQS